MPWGTGREPSSGLTVEGDTFPQTRPSQFFGVSICVKTFDVKELPHHCKRRVRCQDLRMRMGIKDKVYRLRCGLHSTQRRWTTKPLEEGV
jgi:hypothetical protein